MPLKKSLLKSHAGLSLVQIVAATGVLAVVTFLANDAIQRALKTQVESNQRDLLDHLSAEIQGLFQDETICANGIDEALHTNPKFCEGGSVPIRLRQDLGAAGFSVEDRIFVPLPGDNLSSNQGLTLSAMMSHCQVDPLDPDHYTAVIEINAQRLKGFEMRRTINISLIYKGGDHSQLVSCTTKVGQGGSAKSICENVLKGVWDETQKPHCTNFKGAQAAGSARKINDLANVTDLLLSIALPKPIATPLDPIKCRAQFEGKNVVLDGGIETTNLWITRSLSNYTYTETGIGVVAGSQFFEFRSKIDWFQNQDLGTKECLKSNATYSSNPDINIGLVQRIVKRNYVSLNLILDSSLSQIIDGGCSSCIFGAGFFGSAVNTCVGDFYVSLDKPSSYNHYYWCDP